MSRIYSKDAFDTHQKVPSYWEATAQTDCKSTEFHNDEIFDVAIIGGGFTGQSAALHLAKAGTSKVVILDSGNVGWGASGRNGGFCIMGGSKVPYSSLIKKYGLVETKKYVAAEIQAVELVRSIAEQENINFDMTGQGEYLLAHKQHINSDLISEQQFNNETFNLDCKIFSQQELHDKGLKSASLYSGIFTPIGFGLHPLKYVYGLFEACMKRGVNWFEQTTVTAWDKDKNIHHLTTSKGVVRAKKVLIATNGYTEETLTKSLKGTLLPTMSNILVTRPITDEELKQQGWTNHCLSFDSRNLLHYFRLLPDNRLLFGGRGGIDASDTSLPIMKNKLFKDFVSMFPEWKQVSIDYFWRGFVCLSYQLTPHISAFNNDPSIFCALAYHGNGVAMGTWSGQQAAKLILNQEHQIPNFINQQPKSFPLEKLRKLYLRGAYLGYEIKDRYL
ncbi:MAG: glycine/D-amino acid oxidase-like deaminating enzyme [Enterobacterales bacterium]|jgi:glycine/D-amino acid oxidase-like deaminating enzyme